MYIYSYICIYIYTYMYIHMYWDLLVVDEGRRGAVLQVRVRQAGPIIYIYIYIYTY